ncbi:MAG: PD-(D/E)XK nuclease family protein [Gammaproteobacteria bacterium]|nr:PD-(D/E)XK nuclease family protein [Gammaproteobacteria bacterium]
MTAKPDTTTDDNAFFFVEHGINLQQTISEHIYNTLQNQLPDLNQLVIIVPAPDLIYTFRKFLLSYLSSKNINAIIGTEISPLRKWVESNILLNNQQRSFINNHCRQLIILEALQAYPAHFKDENLWQVSASLLQLFDELTLNSLNPSAINETDWQQRLKTLYAVNTNPEHLTNEAQLIYQLWSAWHQQLEDDSLIDQTNAYVQRLESRSAQAIKDKFFIIAGAEKLTLNEMAFIKNLSLSNTVHYFIQASPEDIKHQQHPDHFVHKIIESLAFNQKIIKNPDANAVINKAFEHHLAINVRARHDKTNADSNDNFYVFAAFNEDHESSAVDLQVRQWLLEGKRNIAIVTENRKLARRVRALLERAGINLIDSVGWSLSTTNAASIVERWLQCIEQDFAAVTLLDFLKSPFFKDNERNDSLLNDIFRFEQDIIFHERISGNIQRYKNALQLRKNRLTHWESSCYENIHHLLTELDEQSRTLVSLFLSNKKVAASEYLKALSQSFIQLGITSSLQMNEAGEQVLAEITHMLNACEISDPDMNWFDFRTWLSSAFENHHYSPSSAASHVRLLNLKQSNSGYYDAVIIASTEATQLPGPAPKTPFFNHHVRHSLGLSDWQQHKSEKYYLFRRLLQSAGQTLVTYCIEKNNEEQLPSPWLQTLLDFYQQSQNDSHYPAFLYELLKSNKTSVLSSTDIKLPDLTVAASPMIGQSRIPASFTSSRHQRLINCPYQFFANDVLELKAPEELILELQKSEYGQKVHKILEMYHLSKVPKNTFEDALKLLQSISEESFRQEIEDNFLHRGWLKRWLDHCENYLKWQQLREQEWAFHDAETDHLVSLKNNIELKGRIDRIDKQAAALAIIDYKTSSKTPSQSDVLCGEDIQLSTYALLVENISQVEYLKLDEANGKVSSGALLEAEELHVTTQKTKERLLDLVKQLENNVALISNGNEEVCQFCNMSGLCRKDFWRLNQ